MHSPCMVEHVAETEDAPRPPAFVQKLEARVELSHRSSRHLVDNQHVRLELFEDGADRPRP